jgi:hypothetical protein
VPLGAKTFEVPLGIGQVLKKYQNDVLKSQMDMASKSLSNTFRRFLGSVVKDFKYDEAGANHGEKVVREMGPYGEMLLLNFRPRHCFVVVTNQCCNNY